MSKRQQRQQQILKYLKEILNSPPLQHQINPMGDQIDPDVLEFGQSPIDLNSSSQQQSSSKNNTTTSVLLTPPLCRPKRMTKQQKIFDSLCRGEKVVSLQEIPVSYIKKNLKYCSIILFLLDDDTIHSRPNEENMDDQFMEENEGKKIVESFVYDPASETVITTKYKYPSSNKKKRCLR